MSTFATASCVGDLDADQGVFVDEPGLDQENAAAEAGQELEVLNVDGADEIREGEPRTQPIYFAGGDFAAPLLHGSRDDVPTGAVIANGSAYIMQTRTADKNIVFGVSIKNGRQQLRLSRHDLVTGNVLKDRFGRPQITSGTCNGLAGDFFNFTAGDDVTVGKGADNNLYIVGHARCPASSNFKIGDDRGGHRHLHTSIKGTGILVKLHPDLSVDWAEEQQSDGEAKSQSVAVSKDFVFVAGHFNGNQLSQRVRNRHDPVMRKMGSGFDVFISKYRVNGTETGEMIGIGGSGDDVQPVVTTDVVGNVIIAGSYRSVDAKVYNQRGRILCTLPPARGRTAKGEVASRAFVVKLTASFSRCMWAQTFGGTKDDRPRAVAARWPNVYVGGFFESTWMRAGSWLRNKGGRDGFLVQLDTRSGAIRRGMQVGGSGTDEVTSVGVFATKRVVAGGSYERGIRLGPTTLKSAGGRDPFLVDLDQNLRNPIVRASGRGTGNDEGTVLAVGNGGLIVAGTTESRTFRVGKQNPIPKTGTRADSYLIGLTDRRGLLPLRQLSVQTSSILDFFFTTDEGERRVADDLSGFTDNSVKGYIWPTKVSWNKALHRFYNPTSKDHFLTTRDAEVRRLRTPGRTLGYRYEGIIGYVSNNNFRNAVPFYRLWCPSVRRQRVTRRTHRYVTTLSEVRFWVRQGCKQEGNGQYKNRPNGWLSPARPQPL